MVYVNDILEFMVDKDKSTKFEVSRLIVDREFANDLKNDFCTIKAEMRFDKYDGVLFNKEIKTVEISGDIIQKLRQLPCMIFDMLSMDSDNVKSHILFVTNFK